jgi:DNA primase
MSGLLNLDAIRRDNPLPQIAGAVVKLCRAGGEWKACCPFHSDRTPSFTIYGGGDRFQCFGCGAQGDVIDFVQRLHGVGLRDAAAMLSGGELPTVEVAPVLQRGNGDRLGQVRAIWRGAVPAPGTPAEIYLRWRGLDLAILESIRFARLKYGKTGRDYPCLIACIAGPDNRLCGLQRTFLAENGEGKADVPKPKLSLGRVAGGAIRLAPAAEELVVCEGLEDGLTLQQELGRTVWVSAGTAMLPAMQFPGLVRSVSIGGDADEAGQKAARMAASAFAARGIKTRVFFPVGAKDFNDQLRAAGQ